MLNFETGALDCGSPAKPIRSERQDGVPEQPRTAASTEISVVDHVERTDVELNDELQGDRTGAG